MAGGDSRRLFMFAGYTKRDQLNEKEEISQRIKSLGGDVDLSAKWNPACTHVITLNFQYFHEKVLAALAGGRWLVTRRYVDRSLKAGSWLDPHPFVCDQLVLTHRDLRAKSGGLFAHMRVLFLMENRTKSSVYAGVVRAGGGLVIEGLLIDDLLIFKPGPEQLSHIVVDPSILSPADYRYHQFKEWRKYADQVWDPGQGEHLHYIYYRYFFHRLSRPELETPAADFSILTSRVIEMARANGDLAPPPAPAAIEQPNEQAPLGMRSAPPTPCVAAPSQPASLKRSQLVSDTAAKKARTMLNTYTVTPTVVDLDDSDDDIEILEQRLQQEKETKRSYYVSSCPTTNQIPELVLLDISDDDLDGTDSRDGDLKDSDPSLPALKDQDQRVSGGKVDETEDEEIVLVSESSGNRNGEPTDRRLSLKARAHREKLRELREQEEIPASIAPNLRTSSTDSRESSESDVLLEPALHGLGAVPAAAPPEPVLPPIQPMAVLSLAEGDPATQLINRVLSTLLERQRDTDECIEISNVTWRTARFDKNKESGKLAKTRVRPVGTNVIEEFYNKYIENKEQDETAEEADMLRGEERREHATDAPPTLKAENVRAQLENLEYVDFYTNFTTHPTSAIINILIRDYIMKQPCVAVALKSYIYLDKFLFLHLGRERTEREKWTDLVLSAFRDCSDLSQLEDFSMENVQDIHSCWRFFNQVLQNLQQQISCGSELVESARILFSFIVKITQKDFELWWKHFRKTENKEERRQSFPILYYLLDGSRSLVDNINKSVLSLFKFLLMQPDEDLTDIRKLISMCGMLLAHIDFQAKNGMVFRGQKTVFATKLSALYSKVQLSPEQLYMELALLRPSWLSWLVSKKYLASEHQLEVRGISDVLAKVDCLGPEPPACLWSCLDNFITKCLATMHSHTILRTHWHFQCESQEPPAFADMGRLQKSGHPSHRLITWRTDIVVAKPHILEDCNAIRLFHNGETVAERRWGTLPFLLFTMKDPTHF